ncbi:MULTISPECIES: tryptophan halogenase family protein [unclassified Alteromonas]|uniref:tryptophan halogenase family protein n=1 Tax=unclassified Alteromonas TaxID=2614992 RepID=UPI0019236468|nr:MULTISPECIES: tryptophan halogenase family protein [unclassified Alteromonas]
MHRQPQSNSNDIVNITILGGGTAGWITAGVIAAHHKKQKTNLVNITLVESPTIPIAGVGEGTWPSMRRTLKEMGISETDFLLQCNATFKQGAKFAKWVNGSDNDAYYHPLVEPSRYHAYNLANNYVNTPHSVRFESIVCPQGAVCELDLAPKNLSQREYEGLLNYSYHLDATAFASFLKKHCIEKLGVNHVIADIDQVEGTSETSITALITEKGEKITGDLFIDCSGFKSRLLGKHYETEYVSCQETLFCDRAATLHVDYDEGQTIPPYTISTATQAGWIWDIGLPHRRGIGHVFSSHHMNNEKAKQCLAKYIRRDISDIDIKYFDINPGHRKVFWKHNCVAVGLSAGFLEPLEASSLVLVEMAAKYIAEHLPKTSCVMPIVAKKFNQTFLARWEQIIDFLKLHYVLSERPEPFWEMHRNKDTWPDSLVDNLMLWKYQPPWHSDFAFVEEVFPSASYQYVLYGMQPNFTSSNNIDALECEQLMREETTKRKQQIQYFKNQLYDQRTLLNNIAKFGLPSH